MEVLLPSPLSAQRLETVVVASAAPYSSPLPPSPLPATSVKRFALGGGGGGGEEEQLSRCRWIGLPRGRRQFVSGICFLTVQRALSLRFALLPSAGNCQPFLLERRFETREMTMLTSPLRLDLCLRSWRLHRQVEKRLYTMEFILYHICIALRRRRTSAHCWSKHSLSAHARTRGLCAIYLWGCATVFPNQL